MNITWKWALALTFGFSLSTPVLSGHHNVAVPDWTVAQWAESQANIPTGNVAKGEALSQAGYCYSCHGVAGVNPTQAVPSLAGQNPIYFYKMMKDYQTGRFAVDDKSKVMQALAVTFSDQDLADLAAYYAEQSLPFGQYASGQSGESVKRLVNVGDVSRMLTPCASCHGIHGQGGLNETPAIAGLSPMYFERTMKAYRDGSRHNDVAGGMAIFTSNLTDEEIADMAQYYANLQPKQE